MNSNIKSPLLFSVLFLFRVYVIVCVFINDLFSSISLSLSLFFVVDLICFTLDIVSFIQIAEIFLVVLLIFQYLMSFSFSPSLSLCFLLLLRSCLFKLDLQLTFSNFHFIYIMWCGVDYIYIFFRSLLFSFSK